MTTCKSRSRRQNRKNTRRNRRGTRRSMRGGNLTRCAVLKTQTCSKGTKESPNHDANELVSGMTAKYKCSKCGTECVNN